METWLIILIPCLWYLIGFVCYLYYAYYYLDAITLQDVLIAIFISIIGPLLIPIVVFVSFELFDDIIIYKKK